MPKRHYKRKPVNYYLEYLIVNVFVFVGIWLLSFIVLNIAIFNQFTQAFRDFTLTDIYYSNIMKHDSIYGGPLVLVNIEDKSREEIAYLIQRIEEGNPKVIGVDIIFKERMDSASDELLKNTISKYSNLVFPYIASFDSHSIETRNNIFFNIKERSFVNQPGGIREFATVRNHYPVYNNKLAYTTAVMQMFDPQKASILINKGESKTEIRYFGNVQNFKNRNFNEVMDPSWDPSELKGKIVLLGYMGVPGKTLPNDEDRFFTPLNPQLSGRSHPDMYGVVVHANILRMALDKDYVYVFPTWLNWLVAFSLSLVLLPLFVSWYVEKAVWFHLFTMLVQLFLSIFFVFLTIRVYGIFNIKVESSAVLVSILLIGDFLLFYDHLVKFFKHKMHWNIRSKFLKGSHG